MAATLDHDERVQLARALMQVLDDWQIEMQDRVTLLGLPATTKGRALARYRSGEPLPAEDDIMERAKHLLGIEHALHTTFPTNASMAKYWVSTGNLHFNDQSPLEVMLEGGLAGMTHVWHHLDCTQEWD